MAKRPNKRLRRELRVQSVKAKTTPLDMWRAARQKIEQNIDALLAAPSPNGSAWRDGQVKYWQKLLAELEANRPK